MSPKICHLIYMVNGFYCEEVWIKLALIFEKALTGNMLVVELVALVAIFSLEIETL